MQERKATMSKPLKHRSKTAIAKMPIEALEAIVNPNPSEYDDATQQAAIARLEQIQYEEMQAVEEMFDD
jgi:hypothetical protein